MEITGSKTVHARTEALRRFKTDQQCRVLILSGVGMVGLNIACANIMIIVVSILLRV